ncbi:putative Zn finger-like uncharacterized protein [Variovorax boronicumulans]|uniref:zinc-ribbon and DUF3426 domain-containing protein n=1 Tax=Variovorax boronicumulans TaxID=436515 RepID=UPI002789A7F6|nr:zinc-ribbon and DUF3426 domain-containing protein [Variovorax boronicumulans]MDQ0015819.1 putative Zn finger-like uncharacterized protein [Variovorax boronicumulans]
MSLVTRCPACTTTFKVVRDQLRISDGWVRCGRCSHVFDATLDLHESSDGAPAGAPPAPSPAAAYSPSLVEPSSGHQADAPPAAAQAPSQASEDADFFDDEPEAQAHAEVAHPPPAPEAFEAAEVAVAPQPEPAPPPSPPASPPQSPALSLPVHGIIADEPWSDLDVSEPTWRPPASSLPPFPNIDLNLAPPPPSPPPPVPPLPEPRIKTHGLVEPAIDDGAEEKEEKEEDHDQVQMQKALRRARIKSAKIASANKSREARAAAKAASSSSSSVVREASEPESPASLPPMFAEREEDHRFSDDEEHDVQAPGFWQRKGVRRLLVVLAVLAVLLLILQIVRHERDGIVARQPGLRPALAALCQYTGCELSALRQIGDIMIEGAAFAREKSGGNDYRLSFTLRNAATVPLAMPAVELSLLDTQERAVVRRVLMPADYGAPSVLAARAERAASLPLTLSPTESAALPPIAGYRVEAFYP